MKTPINRKREMRMAMRKGHAPSKAVSIADALVKKANPTTVPANVETVDPAKGTAGADAHYFVNPTAGD